MKVVITGGAGFIGKKLAQRLLQRGSLIGPDGTETPIDELVLFDVARPSRRSSPTGGSNSPPATSPTPPPSAASSIPAPAASSISPPW